MIDTFAAYDRALIRPRTKASLAAKKARGERVGGLPYGWRDEGGRLVEEEAEQVVVRRVREIRAEGASLREVGRRLLAEGMSRGRARGGMCRWWRGWWPANLRLTTGHNLPVAPAVAGVGCGAWRPSR
jgi:DNA invertase Pin-like site-specific DNA recombinase